MYLAATLPPPTRLSLPAPTPTPSTDCGPSQTDLNRLGLDKVDGGWVTGADPGYASTARLQLALLKVALLCGVKVVIEPALLHRHPPDAPIGSSGDAATAAFTLRKVVAAGHDVLFLATGFSESLLDQCAREARVLLPGDQVRAVRASKTS